MGALALSSDADKGAGTPTTVVVESQRVLKDGAGVVIYAEDAVTVLLGSDRAGTLRQLLKRAEQAHDKAAYEEAERLAVQATDIAAVDDDGDLAWEAWQTRCIVTFERAQLASRDLDSVEHLLVSLEEIAKRLPEDHRVQVGTSIHRASWAMEAGRFAIADAALENARRVAGDSGKTALREVALLQTGRHYARAGMMEELGQVIEEGMTLRTEPGPWADLEASLALLTDDPEKADAAFWRAIRATGSGRWTPEAYTHRCEAAEYMIDRGRYAEAARFCALNLDDKRLPSGDRLAIRLSIAEAKSAHGLGDLATAEVLLRSACERSQSRFPYFHGAALYGLASISLIHGNIAMARQQAELACRSFLAADAVPMAVRVTGLVAQSWVSESPTIAETHYETAIRLATSMGGRGQHLVARLRTELVCHPQFVTRSNSEVVALADAALELEGLSDADREQLTNVRGIASLASKVANAIELLSQIGDAATPSANASEPLATHVARRVQSLLVWHAEYPKGGVPEQLLDAWGRGSFAALAADLRRDTLATKLTVTVRSAEEIRRAVRLLAPITDCLVLIWGGQLDRRFVDDLWVPQSWFGDGGPPMGHGYGVWMDVDQPIMPPHARPNDHARMPSSGERSEFGGQCVDWYAAGGFGNYIPRDIATLFLVELRPLVQLGRVVLLPGSLVGCPVTNHHAFDRAFHRAIDAWSVDGTNASPTPDERGSALFVPWFPKIGWADLASLIVDEQESLGELRATIWHHGATAARLGPEGIESARRDFREQARRGLELVRSRFRKLEQRLAESLGPVDEDHLRGAVARADALTIRSADPAVRAVSELAEMSRADPWYWIWKARGLSFPMEIEKVDIRESPAGAEQAIGPGSESERKEPLAHWLVPAVAGWGTRYRLRVPMVREE